MPIYNCNTKSAKLSIDKYLIKDMGFVFVSHTPLPTPCALVPCFWNPKTFGEVNRSIGSQSENYLGGFFQKSQGLK